MKRSLLILLLIGFCLIPISAQRAKILKVAVKGIDIYPQESFLILNMTVQYSRVGKEQAFCIVYADTHPVPTITNMNVVRHCMDALNTGAEELTASNGMVTKVLEVGIPLDADKLTPPIDNTLYIHGCVADANNDKVLCTTTPIKRDVRKLRVTVYEETQSKQEMIQEALAGALLEGVFGGGLFGGGFGGSSGGSNKCYACKGTGECRYCYNSVANDRDNCQQCKGTGRCWDCGGTGEAR